AGVPARSPGGGRCHGGGGPAAPTGRLSPGPARGPGVRRADGARGRAAARRRPHVSVATLLDRLRGGAPRVASGRFRVDGAKALAKLRDFRLADSADYVLELLRAA